LSVDRGLSSAGRAAECARRTPAVLPGWTTPKPGRAARASSSRPRRTRTGAVLGPQPPGTSHHVSHPQKNRSPSLPGNRTGAIHTPDRDRFLFERREPSPYSYWGGVAKDHPPGNHRRRSVTDRPDRRRSLLFTRQASLYRARLDSLFFFLPTDWSRGADLEGRSGTTYRVVPARDGPPHGDHPTRTTPRASFARMTEVSSPAWHFAKTLVE